MGRIIGPQERSRAKVEPLEDRRLLSATVVADISPLGAPVYPYYNPYPYAASKIAQVAGLNLFTAHDPKFGFELWRTDGTAAGTHIVADLVHGDQSSSPNSFVELNGAAYFVAKDALWRTDGTGRGTTKVQLDPSAQYFSKMSALSVFNGAMYFSDVDAKGAARLWRSDGTPGGYARLLRQGGSAPKAKPGDLGPLKPLGDALVFAQKGTDGSQSLWRTDGTAAGTYAIRTGLYAFDHRLVAMGDALYFFGNAGGEYAGTALWRTDGTSDGTTVVSVLSNDTRMSVGMGPASGDRLFFTGYDGERGEELWSSDGTAAGTGLVVDLWPGKGSRTPGFFYPEYNPVGPDPVCSCSSFESPYQGPNSASPSNFAATANGVLFMAWDGTGHRMYHSDGTPEGTVRLDAFGSTGKRRITDIATVGGTVFVAMQDDFRTNGAIYATNGSPDGTRLVWAADPRFGIAVEAAQISGLSEVDGSLFFTGYTHAVGLELMRLDATGGIMGFAHDDANGNGVRDPSELPLAGWRVFLDRNGDGIFNKGENFTFADESGAYGFPAFPDGNYTLRVSRPDESWTNDAVSVPVRRGRASWRDVSAARLTPVYGSVSGTVLNDHDFDGTRDPGERGLEGVRVYLDLNANGYYTPGEPTMRSDASGNYRIDNVLPGRYRVGVVELGAGFEYTRGVEQTVFVAPDGSHDADFGIGYDAGTGMIHGVVFDDRDGDGVQDAGEPGLAGASVRLETLDDRSFKLGERTVKADAGGYYKFTGLKRGKYNVIVDQPGVDWHAAEYPWTGVTLQPHERRLVASGWQLRGTAAIRGKVFVDRNANGYFSVGDQAATGWEVFADLDRDGAHDAGEPSSKLTSDGTYGFYNLFSGTYVVRFVPPEGDWILTHGLWSVEVALKQGETRNLNAGGTLAGKVGGYVYNDANRDGFRELGEVGLAGWRVFLDTNRNGQYERGEPAAMTDSAGYYEIQGLRPGDYLGGLTGLGTWDAMTPPHEIFYVITGTKNSYHFGVAEQPSSTVRGVVVHDLDGNGNFTAGDPKLVGVTVYIDDDEDGVFDDGEMSTQTDHLGNWRIRGVRPGTRTLRVVGYAGSRELTVVSGRFHSATFFVS